MGNTQLHRSRLSCRLSIHSQVDNSSEHSQYSPASTVSLAQRVPTSRSCFLFFSLKSNTGSRCTFASSSFGLLWHDRTDSDIGRTCVSSSCSSQACHSQHQPSTPKRKSGRTCHAYIALHSSSSSTTELYEYFPPGLTTASLVQPPCSDLFLGHMQGKILEPLPLQSATIRCNTRTKTCSLHGFHFDRK
jgi:hypothetical protein